MWHVSHQGRLYLEAKEAIASGPHRPGAPTGVAIHYLLELVGGTSHKFLELLELGR